MREDLWRPNPLPLPCEGRGAIASPRVGERMGEGSTPRQAFTVAELLIAASVTLLLILGLMPLMSASIRAWHRNSNDVATTMDVTLAMRRIASELRAARSVMIADSGKTIYYYPMDGTTGKFALVNGNLTWNFSSNGQPLLRGIVTNDPQFGGAYPLFQLAFGGTSRAVIVRLCVQVNTPAGVRTHRVQQMVVLRNQ